MEDEKIVALYWQRDERAIRETEKKYGRYLMGVAGRVLSDREDRRESVNDAYLRAWDSMPPHRPAVLSAYLGKLARRAAIDLWRKKGRDKRAPSEYALSLTELAECAGPDSTSQAVDAHLLAEAIDAYLRTLPDKTRWLFLRRYYYLDSVAGAARFCGVSVDAAASLLYRTRLGLKKYLQEEGFTL